MPRPVVVKGSLTRPTGIEIRNVRAVVVHVVSGAPALLVGGAAALRGSFLVTVRLVRWCPPGRLARMVVVEFPEVSGLHPQGGLIDVPDLLDQQRIALGTR